MTFGYARAEVVAALINYTTLIVIGIYLLYEAALRVADPQPVSGLDRRHHRGHRADRGRGHGGADLRHVEIPA